MTILAQNERVRPCDHQRCGIGAHQLGRLQPHKATGRRTSRRRKHNEEACSPAQPAEKSGAIHVTRLLRHANARKPYLFPFLPGFFAGFSVFPPATLAWRLMAAFTKAAKSGWA